MPQRKKLPTLPDYQGIARNVDNMLIQKSNPLQSLSETNLTLPELKILDAYLARIDSHKPNERYVRFEKGELENLLGVVKIPRQELEKRLKNLFTAIKVIDNSKRKGFSLIALFVKADCEQDENGQWQVDLACSSEAMEYIFNIENFGYLKYRLKNIISLTSRYSYVLFLYFLDNRFRQSWNISLEELKTMLNCTANTYTEYKRFNDLILKKCHKELTEKTDIKYTYEAVKKGRKVVAIKFTIKTIADSLPAEPVEENLSNTRQYANTYSFENLAFLAEACNGEFDDAEMKIIYDLILQKLPINTINTDTDRYDYLLNKYHILQRYAAKSKIKNRFNYIKKLIEQDI